jgi:hypothetical protein
MKPESETVATDDGEAQSGSFGFIRHRGKANIGGLIFSEAPIQQAVVMVCPRSSFMLLLTDIFSLELVSFGASFGTMRSRAWVAYKTEFGLVIGFIDHSFTVSRNHNKLQ